MEEYAAVIDRNISWFVGKALSFIDITIEDSPDVKDKHPRKQVLKKLFKNDIYNARDNDLLVIPRKEFTEEKVAKIFKDLLFKLINYSVTAIPEKLRRDAFNALVANAADIAISKIFEEIEE